MSNWTAADLNKQLNNARKNGLFGLLKAAAAANDLPLAYVLAVASRETGIRNIAGDGGHGRGVMQIDDRYHDAARNTDFKAHPDVLIDYGVELLASNVKRAKKKWPKYNSLKIGASAYNAGFGGATIGVNKGNSDLRTTGGDYGADVLDRMGVFEELLST